MAMMDPKKSESAITESALAIRAARRFPGFKRSTVHQKVKVLERL
jgi:hypothetical protein